MYSIMYYYNGIIVLTCQWGLVTRPEHPQSIRYSTVALLGLGGSVRMTQLYPNRYIECHFFHPIHSFSCSYLTHRVSPSVPTQRVFVAIQYTTTATWFS